MALPFSLETATRRRKLSHRCLEKKPWVYLDLVDLWPVYGAAQNTPLKLCQHASPSTFRDAWKRVWAARWGIPSPAIWKRQQLVMQSTSRGRSRQLSPFPPRLEGSQPRRTPGAVGRCLHMGISTGSWSSAARGTRRTSLQHVPELAMPSAAPAVMDKEFCEKMGENLGIQDSKTHRLVASGC